VGYATLLGDPEESIGIFMPTKVIPRLAELGYELSICTAAFFAECHGIRDAHRLDPRVLEIADDVSDVLDSGFSIEPYPKELAEQDTGRHKLDDFHSLCSIFTSTKQAGESKGIFKCGVVLCFSFAPAIGWRH
jgi:hypothetical protein